MGLTLYWSLRADFADDDQARAVVRRMHTLALDLPFLTVSQLVDVAPPVNAADNQDPASGNQGLLLREAELMGRSLERSFASYDRGRGPLRPIRVIGFRVSPGHGCEITSFGLACFAHDDPNTRTSEASSSSRWYWSDFCKTLFASDPEHGGVEHFLRCHLGLIEMLDHLHAMGIVEHVRDEGGYWESRSTEQLKHEVAEEQEDVTALSRTLQDTGGAAGMARYRAVPKYPNVELLKRPDRGTGHVPREDDSIPF